MAISNYADPQLRLFLSLSNLVCTFYLQLHTPGPFMLVQMLALWRPERVPYGGTRGSSNRLFDFFMQQQENV